LKLRILLIVLSLFLVPATAGAAWRDNPFRDPQAPCFRWPARDYDGDGVWDRVDHCVDTPRGCTVDQFGCSSDSDGDGVCDGLDLCPHTPAGKQVDEHGCEKGGRVARQPPPKPVPPPVEKPKLKPQPASPPPVPENDAERQLIQSGSIRLENVYFETGSAKLLPESETALDEAGAALEKYPGLGIEIQGHTDTRGSESYNLQLSQARAEAVRTYLLYRFRIPPGNLIAKGYGESQPETRERNQEELLRNRRVVLKVLKPGALPKGIQIQKK
jgi:OmpA-OmpF porin, OOP family